VNLIELDKDRGPDEDGDVLLGCRNALMLELLVIALIVGAVVVVRR